MTPWGENSSTSRRGGVAPGAAQPSSAGRKRAAAALTPSALNNPRRDSFRRDRARDFNSLTFSK